jgi:hypothetical protein
MKNLILNLKQKSGKTHLFSPATIKPALSGFILIILFLISTQNLKAQNIKEYSDLTNSLTAADQQSKSSETKHLKSLVFDLMPKIYINNKEEKTFGNEPPVCLNTDANSVELLYEANALFEKVELISININNPGELNFILDFSKLNSFINLKYVQFLCSFECDPILINQLYKENSKTGMIVFYRISLPE